MHIIFRFLTHDSACPVHAYLCPSVILSQQPDIVMLIMPYDSKETLTLKILGKFPVKAPDTS